MTYRYSLRHVIEKVTDSSDHTDSSDDDSATQTASGASDGTAAARTATSLLAGAGWCGLSIGHYNRLSGRVRQRNAFHESLAVKPAVRRVKHSPYDAWECFIDETMVSHIHPPTIRY